MVTFYEMYFNELRVGYLCVCWEVTYNGGWSPKEASWVTHCKLY